MVLFIIKNSVWKENVNFLNYAKKGDIVLLIQDGVLILNIGKSDFSTKIKEKNIELMALKDDLKLRGIKNNAKAKLIDYNGLVELIEKNKVFS